MEGDNLLCDENCRASATKFYIGNVSKKKVCEEHAQSVVQTLYPIEGFYFISTPEDADLYRKRLEAVANGRNYLERLRRKASEELETALLDLDSAKDKAVEILTKAYEANKRRTRQLHYQIEVGIRHLLQEFDHYLRSPVNTVSQLGSLLMTGDPFVPTLFQSKVIDNYLELAAAAIQGTRFALFSLEEYLSIVLDPDLRRQEAEKLLSQAEDESLVEGCVTLQKAVFKCSESISLQDSDRAKELLTSMESRLIVSIKGRNEAITQWLTRDTQTVSSIIETALNDIGTFEAVEEWDKIEQTYLKAVSYAYSFSCSKQTAVLYSSFANFLVKRERIEEAESYFKHALLIQKEYFPEALETADSYEKLGSLSQSINKFEEAENCYKSAIAIRKVKQPNDDLTSKSYYELAKLYQYLERYEEAKEAFSSALSIQRVCVPKKDHLVCILKGLGEVCREMKNYDESVQYFIEAINEETLNSQRQAFLFQDLGDVYKCLEQKAKAEENFNSAFAIYKLLPPSTIEDARHLHQLGTEFGGMERLEDAEFCYLRAFTVTEYTSTDRYADALLHYHLSNIKSQQNKDTEAMSNMKTALSILEVDYPTHKLTVLAYLNLGLMHPETNQELEGEDYFRSAAKIIEQNRYSLALSIIVNINLGLIYCRWGRVEEAEQRYRSLLTLLETQWPNHICTAHVLLNLGALYMKMGRFTDSEISFLRSLQIIEVAYPDLHNFMGVLYYQLGYNCYLQDKDREAVDYLIKAISLGVYGESSTEQRIIDHDFPIAAEDVYSTEEQFFITKQGLIVLLKCILTAHRLLGKILSELRQYPEAENYLKTAVEIERTDGDNTGPMNALMDLKEFYFMTNQIEKLRRLEQERVPQSNT